MATDKMQQQRFEQKYMLTEEVALQVREFLRCYLELDENGVGKPNCSYPVHSLYLDNDHLFTYWETINGNKNRFKLRMRFYNSSPETPVFFEIKRRMNNCILKQRGGVRKDAVPWLLAGHLPEPGHLLGKDSKSLVAIHRFCQLVQELNAKPKVHIYYQREAWVHPTNNSVRVTLDREVTAEPEPTTSFETEMKHPWLPFGKEVILELKFTNRFPDWFSDLVRVFGLMQCGAAKYCEGIAMMGEYRVDQRLHAPPPTSADASEYSGAARPVSSDH